MNQLGGIGRGRSQLGVTADGINCSDKQDNLKKFRRYLFEINDYIQTVLLPTAIKIEGVSNEFSNYELCLVGNRESFISDICSNNSHAYDTITKQGFGTGSQNVIFTHLLTIPLSEGADYVPNPLSITYWNNDGWTNTTLNFDLLQNIQDKINFCNNYLRTIRPNLFITGRYPMNTLGTHTLGLINNNILLDGTSATSFLQNLHPNSYGTQQLFYSNSPLTNNSINIFTGNTTYLTSYENKILSTDKNNFIVGSQIFLKKSDGTSQNLVLINHSKPEEPSIKYSEITNSKYEYTVVAIYENRYRDDLITLITNQGIGDTVFIDDCETDNSTYLHNLYGINSWASKNTNTEIAVKNIINFLKCVDIYDSNTKLVIFIELVNSYNGSPTGVWVFPQATYSLNDDDTLLIEPQS